MLFTSGALGQVYSFKIEVMSLADRRRKILIQAGTDGRYLATSAGAGYLIYLSQGALFAVPFDLKTLEVRGNPVPVLERVDYSAQFGGAWFDASRSGILVYRSETQQGNNVVQWMDSAGKTQPLLAKPGNYLRPRL